MTDRIETFRATYQMKLAKHVKRTAVARKKNTHQNVY